MNAAELSPERLQAAGVLQAGQRFGAAICTLGLSVIPDWQRAFEAMLSVVRSGGRVAVMDGGYPVRAGSAGEARLARPLLDHLPTGGRRLHTTTVAARPQRNR